MDLQRRSIQLIRRFQAESGAYIASPSFPTYAYCWLRDGSFIAYAMDIVGECDSASAFFRWAARTIQRYAAKVDRALQKRARGLLPDSADYLHTRYTLDGLEVQDDWGNFQLDGYGTWLWALSQHVALTQDAMLVGEVAGAVRTTVRYLSAMWMLPNYDCWEEHPELVHPYTLAAVYAGLRAAHALAGRGLDVQTADGQPVEGMADEVRRFILERGVQDGHLVKHIGPQPSQATTARLPAVDASLVGVMTPYQVVAPQDPLARATVESIERDLHCPGGGVHRYLADSYYGGGEWVLLAAWLGWHYVEVGALQQAVQLLHWIEAQADTAGNLPEQVSAHLLAPNSLPHWQARWGPVARPLLWSHAMYLVLRRVLEGATRG